MRNTADNLVLHQIYDKWYTEAKKLIDEIEKEEASAEPTIRSLTSS